MKKLFVSALLFSFVVLANATDNPCPPDQGSHPITVVGPQGPQGPQGIQGVKGDTGATGLAGANGKEGINGTNGKDGAQGLAGISGKNGSNGTNGAKGDTGVAGATGAQGEQGLQGIQGIQGLAGHDADTSNLLTKDQFRSFKKDTYGGLASVLAIAGLPQPTAPGKTMVSGGVANYHGQQGFALGVSRVTTDERFVLKAGVSTSTRGDFGAAVAAGYQF